MAKLEEEHCNTHLDHTFFGCVFAHLRLLKIIQTIPMPNRGQHSIYLNRMARQTSKQH